VVPWFEEEVRRSVALNHGRRLAAYRHVLGPSGSIAGERVHASCPHMPFENKVAATLVEAQDNPGREGAPSSLLLTVH